MYGDLLTLGFLASFEMLSAAFLQAWLGLAARSAWWPPCTLAVVVRPQLFSPFPQGLTHQSVSNLLLSNSLTVKMDGASVYRMQYPLINSLVSMHSQDTTCFICFFPPDRGLSLFMGEGQQLIISQALVT